MSTPTDPPPTLAAQVEAAWQSVVAANIAAQQRLNPDFPMHGDLYVNIAEIQQLLVDGHLTPELADTAPMLWTAFLIAHQTDRNLPLDEISVAACVSVARRLIDALNAIAE